MTCERCSERVIEIDYYGERLVGAGVQLLVGRKERVYCGPLDRGHSGASRRSANASVRRRDLAGDDAAMVRPFLWRL
jgi:hypothetical protein